MIVLPMPTRSRVRRVILATLVALALVTPAALVARAADVPELRGPVTDETGVLSGGESTIESAVNDLVQSANVQLWVVFVPTTDTVSAGDFASQIATQNQLGSNDALLLVALDDRTDFIWRSNGLGRITNDELDEIIGRSLEPKLAAGDFTDAVLTTIKGLNVAANEDVPAGGAFEQPAGGGLGGLLPALLILAGLGLLAWWFISRRRQHRDTEERDRRTGRLAREANALLIATDDRVRDAGQEIGFVEAEYGESEVGPLRDAIGQAREELRQAFAVRQRLDDSEPETPEQREAMLNEIVERSKKAQAALDAQAERIQTLRNL